MPSLRRTCALGLAAAAVLPAAARAGNAPSYTPQITPDGRYVVFESSASDLGTGIVNGSIAQVFRHDRGTGDKIVVSQSQAGEPGDAPSNEPQVSDNGRYVVYSSAAKNLSTRDDDPSRDVFVTDLQMETTRIVSVRSDGGIGQGNSQEPSISADGRFVAFSSRARLDPSDTNFEDDVYLRDLIGGTTTLVSRRPDAGSFGHAAEPAISDDGRYVAFTSAVALLPGAAGTHAYRFDTLTGALALVSASATGTPANGGGSSPAISADGRYVAFRSGSSNLVGASNGSPQIYAKDMQGGSVTLVSAYSTGLPFNGTDQDEPSISPNGTFIAFESDESTIGAHAGPNGNVTDVYVNDRFGFDPRRLSVGSDAAYHHHLKPALTADATPRVVWQTVSQLGWDAGDRDTISDVYAKVTGVVGFEWISRNSQVDPAPNPPSSLNPLYLGSSSSSVRLAVRDNADNEDRFELRYRRLGADWSYRDVAARTGTGVVGCAAGELAAGSVQNYCFDVTGLNDGTGYEFQLRARKGPLARSGWSPLAASRTLFPNEIVRRDSYNSSPLGDSQLKGKRYTVLGDPVDVRFGNFVYDHTDLSMPGLGPDVEIKRTYNSALPVDGVLGFGWAVSFDTRVTVSSGVASVRRSDGRVDRFTRDTTNNTWVPSPGAVDRLVDVGGGGYRLQGRDDLVQTFNASGLLTSVADSSGNAITFFRNASNQVTLIRDAASRTWTITYTAAGRISRIEDPAGRRTDYEYDGSGNLVSFYNPANGRTQYAYDALHRLTRITDARGNLVVSHVYGDDGKVYEQTDARGVTLFEYFAGYTVVTDPLGRETRTQFDPDTFVTTRVVNPAGGERRMTYDAVGRLLTDTDELGRVTSYAYDARGNQTKVTDALGNVTNLAYDAGDDIVSITDPRGGVTSFVRSPTGLVTSKTDPAGDVTSYTYDARGQMLSETVAGRTTTFAYDAVGNRTGVTDGRGETTTYGYDAAGRITSVTDPLGNVTRTTYNALDLPLDETAADGAVTTHGYDATGNETRVTDPRGGVTTKAYDEANQLVRVTDALGGVTVNVYDKGGRLLRTTDPDGRTTTYRYDVLDRRTAVVAPSGSEQRSAYDAVGNLLRREDAEGQVTAFTYDAANRLKTVTEPGGGVTTYAYNAAGDPTTVTDALGHTTTFTVDGAGRRIKVTDATGAETTTTYDASGRTLTVTDATGATLTNAYDASGNLLSRTAGGRTEAFTYDDAGRLAAAAAPNGTVTLTRDAVGRITRAETPQGVLVAEFDAAGNRTRVATPHGDVRNTYDPLGRLTQVARDGSEVARYAYSAAGRPVLERLADGATTVRSYDADGRLSSLITRRGDLILQRTRYALDRDGRRLRETASGMTARYGYDALGRLTSATMRLTPEAGVNRARTETYGWTYDAVGNRLTETRNGATATATYDAANRLRSFDGRAVSVDAAGRLLDDGRSTYSYDGFGRLIAVGGRNAASYTVDALGERVTETVGGTTHSLLVDAGAALPQVLERNGASIVYGHDRILDGDSVLHADGLGSARRALGTDGRVRDAAAFAPFGARLAGAGAFGFAGEQQRGHLVHLRARDYSTELGRFLTADPAPSVPENPQTANLYAYAVNDPVRITDPAGLCGICGFFSWVGQGVSNAVGALLHGGGGGAKPVKNPVPAAQPKAITKGLAESNANKPSIISTYGGGLISDNGGGLISDNGLGLLSDNGLGIVSTYGSGLIGQAGGNLIGQAGGNLIGQAGGNLIGQAGGNLIGQAGGNLIGQAGGNLSGMGRL